MSYTLTKNADGDLSLGNLRGELVTLQPSVSDYATAGYLIQGVSGPTETTGNVGLSRVLGVIPVGGQGGYLPVFNPITSKLQMFNDSTSGGPGGVVQPNTDLSAYAFQLLILGY